MRGLVIGTEVNVLTVSARKIRQNFTPLKLKNVNSVGPQAV